MMDIDIDFPSTFDPLELFEQAVRASMVKNGDLAKHPVGIYFQNIAKDKLTDLSAIPYEEAEKLGFFKIDFLHLTVLDHFNSKDEIRALLKIEPDWNLLQDEKVVEKLFHLHRHISILRKVQPTSIEEVADCIALKLPSKRVLLNAYSKNKELIRKELYSRPDDGSVWFKKGHAIAYAMVVVLQLHLIKGGIV